MIDPGAMGTLIIGLDAVRSETQHDRRRRPANPPRRLRTAIRAVIARNLRRAASLLERPALGEVVR